LGGVGLLVYWIPIFAAKGGKVHVRFGRYFVWCAYGVSATALVISALRFIEPLESVPRAVHIFLAYLGIVTFGFVRQAVLVTRTRRDPSRLTADKGHHALGLLCILASLAIIGVGLLGDSGARILLLALSPIGFVAGGGILSFRRNPTKTPRAWWYAHMAAILGAGIAFHTAFLVFGGARFIQLSGALQIVPWILPTLIGVPAIFIWVGRYKKKFGET
jgi:hypothetical protein